MLDEIRKINSSPRNLREFGLTIGAILVIIGVAAIWRGKAHYIYYIASGALLAGLGIFLPALLKPPQKIWMAFAVVLGFVMARVVLFVIFFAVMTPISLMLRMAGRDLLDRTIEKDAPTYWKKMEAGIKPKESYENQY